MTRNASRRTTAAKGGFELSTLPVGPVPVSLGTAELERRDTGVLLRLDGTESSFIDLADPTHLDFEYQQQMEAAIGTFFAAGTPVRAVHLGGAACALARAWNASRPGSTQLAVELDELLASKVRQWFDLPRSPALRIRVGDAAAVAPTLRPGEWDVVVRDVFAQAVVPETVRTLEFTQACARALAPGGLYLANMSSLPRPRAAAELQVVRETFKVHALVADNAVARGKRRGNMVVVAANAPWTPQQREELERSMRRLPLPARTWELTDPALPQL
ncbi:spermidine synthase [Actinomyces bovis]|uniref:Spermidine synthase n=1 Tax=Actinomyces bovis TaxID=1658 RepID=A0ABY1VPD6_9ACTO|nr:fused MFS/spermidine synthase [Actinomyces bovis]SPT53920.1 spermidine synthase [Actinomyces bovis]VEG53403.1 spermidine synthase [Actinomyces israelii]